MYPTRDDIQEAFQLFVGDMNRAMRCECYLAAVMLAVMIPDACGAVESELGRASGAAYRRWCDLHLARDERLTPLDRYQLRCSLIHEGSTKPRSGQYGSFSLLPPGTAPAYHLTATQLSDGSSNLAIQIELFVGETVVAVNRWYEWLQQPGCEETLQQVGRNLSKVISPRPKELPDGTTHYFNLSSTDYTPSWQVDSE